MRNFYTRLCYLLPIVYFICAIKPATAQQSLPFQGNTTVSAQSNQVYQWDGLIQNANAQITLVPVTESGQVQVRIQRWQLPCESVNIYVYDGPNTSAPLMGIYSCVAPEALQPSPFNTSGSLTLRLVSEQQRLPIGIALSLNTVCRGGVVNTPTPVVRSGETAILEYQGSSNPAQLRWEFSTDQGRRWQNYDPQPNGTTLHAPQIRQTTLFRVQNNCGLGQPAYSTLASVEVPNLNKLKSGENSTMTGVCGVCTAGVASITAKKNPICLNERVELTAFSEIPCRLRDEFDAGINTAIWSFNSGTTAVGCGASPASGSSLYFNTASSVDRVAMTNSFNTNLSCFIGFYFRYGTLPFEASTTCEEPDLPTENVVLEYSVAGGPWINITTFDKTSRLYDSWKWECIAMPAGAKTPSTRFRLRQPANSGVGFDHWQIDGFIIDVTTKDDANSYTWSPALTPTRITTYPGSPVEGTFTYTVTATNACGNTARSTIAIEVTPPPLPGRITPTDSVCRFTTNNISLVGFRGFITRWEVNPDCAEWRPVPGGTPISPWRPIPLTLSTIPFRFNNAKDCFRAFVKTAGCDEVVTDCTIIHTRNMGLLPDPAYICPGDPLPANHRPMRLTNSNCKVIRWEQSTDFKCQRTPQTAVWTTIPGVTGYSYSPPRPPYPTCFRVMVQCSTGCDTVMADNGLIWPDTTIIPPAVETSQLNYCIGSDVGAELRAIRLRYQVAWKDTVEDAAMIVNNWFVSTSPQCDCQPAQAVWTQLPPEFDSQQCILPPLFTRTTKVCYRYTATSAARCSTVISDPIAINWLQCQARPTTLPRLGDVRLCPGRDTILPITGMSPRFRVVRWELGPGSRTGPFFPVCQSGGPAFGVNAPDMGDTNCFRAVFEYDTLLNTQTSQTDAMITNLRNFYTWIPTWTARPRAYFETNTLPTGVNRVNFWANRTAACDRITTPCPFDSCFYNIPRRAAWQIHSNVSCAWTTEPITAGVVTPPDFVCVNDNNGCMDLVAATGPPVARVARWEYRVFHDTIPCNDTTMRSICRNYPNGETWWFIDNITRRECFKNLSTSREYRAMVANSCDAYPSVKVRIDVDSVSKPGTIFGLDTICAGDPVRLVLKNYSQEVLRWQEQVNCTGTWRTVKVGTERAINDSFYVSPPLATTTCFRAEVRYRTTGPCPALFANFRVVAIPIPTPGTTTGGTNICLGEPSPTLRQTGHDAPIAYWQRSEYCTGEWFNIAHRGVSYTPPPITINTCYRAMIGVGACLRPATSTTVTVDATTIPGVIEGPTDMCPGLPFELKLTENTGTIVEWQQKVTTDCGDATPYTPVAGSAGARILTRTFVDAICFRVLVKNGVCASGFTPVHVVARGVPTVAGTITASDPAVCAGLDGGTVTLAGNVGRVLRWERSTLCPDLLSPTTIANTTTTQAVGPVITNVCFRAVVQSGSCAIERTNIASISIVSPPTGGRVRDDQSSCASTRPVGMSVSGHIGTVLRWESSTNCATFASPTPIPATAGLTFYRPGLLTTTTCFRAVIGSGTCPPANSLWATVTILPSPDGGRIEPGRTVCGTGAIQSGTLTLAGMSGGIGSPTWQFSTGADCFGPTAFSSATTMTASGPGGMSHNYNVIETTCFRSFIDNAIGCRAFSIPAIIELAPPTIAGSLSRTQDICTSGRPDSLVLTGFTGRMIRWERNTTAGVFIENVSVTTSKFFPDKLDASYCYRAVVQSGTCPEAKSNQVCINILPDAGGGAVTGGSPVCFGTGTGTLTLAGHTGTVKFWEKNVASGGWTSVVNTGTTFSETSITQPTCYRAVIESALCPEVRSTPTCVTIIDTTIAGIVDAAAIVCAGTAPPALRISSQRGAVLDWESSTNSFGTVIPLGITATSYTPPALTTTTCYRVRVRNGSCPPKTTAPVCITVDQRPVTGTIQAAQTICEGDIPATLRLVGKSGNVAEWQSQLGSSPWTNLSVRDTFYTATAGLTASTCYRAIVNRGVCPAETSAVTCISVDRQSVGGTLIGGVPICRGETRPLTLTGHVSNVRWLEFADDVSFSPVSTISTTSATFTPDPMFAPRCFRYVVSNGVCAPVRSTPTCFTIQGGANPGTIGSNQSLCSGGTPATIRLTGYAGVFVRWEEAPAANLTAIATISHVLDNYSPGPLTASTCYRAVLRDAGSCGQVESPWVCMTVSPPTVAGTIASANTICAGFDAGALNLTGRVGRVVRWESAATSAGPFAPVAFGPASYNADSSRISLGLMGASMCFQAVVKSGVCPEATAPPVCITVLPSINAGRVINGAAVCLNAPSPALELVGNDPLVGDVRIREWQSADDFAFTTGILPIANTTTRHTEPTMTRNRCFRAVLVNASSTCPESFSIPTCVSVVQPSVAGPINSPATVCTGTNNGTLTLSSRRGNVLDWIASANDFGTISSINTRDTFITYNNLGARTCYRAIVQNGVCPPETSATVCIDLDQLSLPGTLSSNATLCQGTNSHTLNLATPRGALRFQTSVDDFGTVASENATPTFPMTLTNVPNTTTYRVIARNGTCPPETSNVVRVQVDLPSIAGTIQSPDTLCASGNSGVLRLVGQRGQILGWDNQEGTTAPFLSAGHADSTQFRFNNLLNTTCYRARVRNGTVCPAETTAVTCLTVDPITVPGTVSSSETFCSLTNSTTLRLAGHVGTILYWQISTDTTCSAYNPIAGSGNNANLDITNLAQTRCYRAVVKSGVCDSALSSAVQLTVVQPGFAGQLQRDQTICADDPTPALRLDSLRLVNYFAPGRPDHWEFDDNPGFTRPTVIANTRDVQFPDPTFLFQTQTCFQVRVINRGCVEYSTPACITRLPEANPGAVTPAGTICNGASWGPMTWNSPTNTEEVVRWERRVGTSTTWSPIVNTTRILPIQTNIRANTCYRTVVRRSSICPEIFSPETCVTVDDSASGGTIAATRTTICAGDDGGILTLSGQRTRIIGWESSTDNINWTLNSSAVSATLNVGTLTTTTCYRAVVDNATCPAVRSLSRCITVDQRPTPASAGRDTTLCVNAITLNSNRPTIGTASWRIVLGTATFSGSNTIPNAVVTNLNIGTNQLEWRIVNGVCPPSFDFVNVIRDPLPTPANAGLDQTICVSNAIVRGNTPTIGTSSWAVATGTGILALPDEEETPVSNISVGTNRLVYSIESGVCPISTDTVIIQRDAEPTAANAGAPQTVCQDWTTVIAAPITIGTGRWTSSPGIVIDNPTSLNTRVNVLAFGDNTVTWTTSNGVCPPSVSTVRVTRETPPSTAFAGRDTTICAANPSLALRADIPTVGTGFWEVASGVPGIRFANINDPRTIVSALGHNRTILRWTVRNGISCPPSSDAVEILVDSVSVGGSVFGGKVVCQGDNAGAVVLQGQRGVVLGWQSNTNGGTFTPIAGTAGRRNISYTNVSQPTCFQAIVQNGVCPPATATQTCLTIDLPSIPGTILQATTVCPNDPTERTLQLTAYRGGIVQWEYSTEADFSDDVTVVSVRSDRFTFSNLGQTTYFRTYVVNGVCDTVISPPVQITVREPSLRISSQNLSCFGANDGQATVQGTGGVPFRTSAPYRYLWTYETVNFSIQPTISGLAAGNYCVTVTDSIGCIATGCVRIQTPPAFTAAVTFIRQVSCGGNRDGIIDIAVNGGVEPYTYQWFNESNTIVSTAQNLSAIGVGTYRVIITDAMGCTANLGPITLNAAAPIEIRQNANIPVRCAGSANGSLGIDVFGGVSPYIYRWSNGSNIEDPTGLSGGTFTLTVIDAAGCRATRTFTVMEPAPIRITRTQTTLPTCHDATNGSVAFDVTGGTRPYRFNWSNGQTTEDIMGIGAGSYTLTVIDANACTATRTIQLDAPQPLIGAIRVVNHVACSGGNSGVLEASAIGGTAPYSYRWSNNMTTANATNFGAGTHAVTITDARGCSTSVRVQLEQGNPIQIVDEQITPVRCHGQSTGSIAITVAGGSGSYTYRWADSGVSNQDRFNLAAGTYTITITDSRGCTLSRSFVIGQPTAPLAASIQIIGVDCQSTNAQLVSTITGGTSPYRYAWSNGQTTAAIAVQQGGTYVLTVTDAQNCLTITQAVVAPSTPIVITEQTLVHPRCFGDVNGAIGLQVAGGNAPYTYQWDHGPNTEDLQNLGDGTYRLTVRDARSCLATYQGTLRQPTAINVSVMRAVAPACAGGATGNISVESSGGTPPYSYAWNNGQTTPMNTGLSVGSHTVIVSDANGCTATQTIPLTDPRPLAITLANRVAVRCAGGNNGQLAVAVVDGQPPYTYRWTNGSNIVLGQDPSLSFLRVGTYTVAVTDANGCTATATYTISEPAPLTGTVTATAATCEGATDGQLAVVASGGTPTYSYRWNTEFTGTTLTGLAAGRYSVAITDRNGCRTTLTGDVMAPTPVAIVPSITPAGCKGAATGAIRLTISGGTTPYSYRWENNSTASERLNLSAGTYAVTVTDSKACTAIIASIQVAEPTTGILVTNRLLSSPRCANRSDGAIAIDVSGGTSPYRYAWSNGAAIEDITAIPAGEYVVTVTDAAGCSIIHRVSLTAPVAVTLTRGVVRNATCAGSANGGIDISPTGGTLPLSYNWSNNSTAEDLSNVRAGSYSVIIQDANGCEARASYLVSEPAQLVIALDSMVSTGCLGGSIFVTPTGGTAPYRFRWSNTANAQHLTGATAGRYTLWVTDANDCEVSRTFDLPGVSPMQVGRSEIRGVRCAGEANGAIQIDILGGRQPLRYTWTTGETTEDISNLRAGNYGVEVLDGAGCRLNLSFTVSSPTALSARWGLTRAPLCGNSQDGQLRTIVSGGTAPYRYAWSNGSSGPAAIELGAGLHSVTITDANGCSTSLNQTLSAPEPVTIIPVVVRGPSCHNTVDGVIELNALGGISPYTYTWGHGPSATRLTGLRSGTYSVSITDARGCGASRQFVLVAPEPLMVNVSAIVPAACGGSNLGAIDMAVSGGVGPYSFRWSNGSTAEDVIDVSAGEYVLTVTDANGCAQSRRLLVPSAQPPAIETNVPNAVCIDAEPLMLSGTPAGGRFMGPGVDAAGRFTPRTAGSGLHTLVYSGTVDGCPYTRAYAVRVHDEVVIDRVLVGSGKLAYCVSDMARYRIGTLPSYSLIVQGQGVVQTGLVNFFVPSQAGVGAHEILVTATDIRTGCSAKSSISIVVSAPIQISVQSSATEVCQGDSALLTANGATRYEWAPNTGLSCAPPCNTSSVKAAPAVATTYTVTGWNGGCSVQQTVAVSVKTRQPIAVRAGSTALCPGQSTVLTASSTQDYTYRWMPGGVAENPLRISPTTSTTYAVIGTASNGCTQTASIAITVNANALRLLTDRDTVCAGELVDIRLEDDLAGELTYVWTPREALTFISPKHVRVRLSTTTTFSVLRLGSSVNCSTAVKTIAVRPQPTVTLFGLPEATCLSASAMALTASLPGGSWSGPGVSGAVFTPATAGVGFHEVVYSGTANGCPYSINRVVQVRPNPVVSILGLSSSYCAISDAVTLRAIPAGGSWNGTGVTGSSFSPVAAGAGSHDLVYSGTDALGCAYRQVRTVAVVAVPVVTYDLAPYYCLNSNPATLTASPVGGTFSGSGIRSSEFVPTLSGMGAHTVTYSGVVGPCAYSKSMSVTVLPALGVTAVSSNPSCATCSDGAITASATGGSGTGYRYGLNTGPMNTTNVFNSLPTGSYVVHATDDKGCAAETTSVLSFNACATPNVPQANVLPSGVLLRWGAVAGATSYDVRWTEVSTGVVRMSRVTGLSMLLTILRPGLLYQLEVRAVCASGESNFSTPVFATPMMVKAGESVAALQSLSIYPNPASDNISVSFDAPQAGTCSIALSNVAGQTVFESARTVEAGAQQWSIALPSLASGAYVLRFSNGTQVRVMKLWIE
jgi:hypothetical protein